MGWGGAGSCFKRIVGRCGSKVAGGCCGKVAGRVSDILASWFVGIFLWLPSTVKKLQYQSSMILDFTYHQKSQTQVHLLLFPESLLH